MIGDVALLSDSNRAFMVGLVAFLLAHVAYVIAFLGVAAWSPHVAIVAIVIVAASLLLLRAIWKGAAGMHAATIAYAVVISAMVVSAWATVGGPAPDGAVRGRRRGAVLHLGREPGAQPLPQARSRTVALLAMGVYWLGQLGIAIAASASF